MTFDQSIKELAPAIHIHLPTVSGYGSFEAALSVTTHIAIVAHADDDGLMAGQAISETFDNPEQHMTVLVVSASPGTGRPKGYEQYDDVAMAEIRRKEQIEAANVGHYAATAQLGFSKQEMMGIENGSPQSVAPIEKVIKKILEQCPRLHTVYLHSIFDEHETHQTLVLLCLEAMRGMREEQHPKYCYGVEVSSDLSWVPKEYKVRLPVPRIRRIKEILRSYRSEIAKRRYDKGVEGRAVSNAVFQREVGASPDQPYLCGIDYKPILSTPKDVPVGVVLGQMMDDILGAFVHLKRRYEKMAAYSVPRREP